MESSPRSHMAVWSRGLVGSTRQTETIPSPLPVYMATKLGRMRTNLEGHTHNATRSFGHVFLRDDMANLKDYISATIMLMAIKLGRGVTYYEGIKLIKSHHHIITWSAWQTKTIISPLAQCLWLQNLIRWQLTFRDFLPKRHMNIYSRDLARLHDKRKVLYLHHHNAYEQTWQDIDLPWAASTHKVTWPYSHVVFQNRVKN